MAMPTATQLVQYANDAVDVYYSDGSRLQLSACGAAFRYYHPSYAGQHPLHAQRQIQQRTEFATSEFRQKVQDALDFRNRFAQRPFLCQNLLPVGTIVSLHADITEVAWPTTLEEACVTEGTDGSLRLVSSDEYAAVTLSPHGQFVTSEVLCKTSRRHTRRRALLAKGPNVTAALDISDTMPSPIANAPVSQSNMRSENEDTLPVSSSHADQSVLSDSTPHNSTPYSSANQSRAVTNDPPKSSVMARPDVEQDNTRWCYVWVSQHHSMADLPDSWKHPVSLIQQYAKDKTGRNNQVGETGKEEQKKTNSPIQGEVCEQPSRTVSIDTPDILEKTDIANKTIGSQHGDGLAPHHSAMSTTERRAVTLQRLLKKDFATCTFLPAPCSLPLNCPSLHLHRWRPEVITANDNEQAEAAYMYGKVNVICSQGIIYRLLWNNPRSVEIYPGDGSLMRSTGLSGHFFTHHLPRPNKVEERTYCTQSPPPTVPGAPYSVAKLITRAARFLKHLCEESLSSLLNEDPCCWAVSPSESDPLEPLPTILLEECHTEDGSYFTASSNGHIRILFSDRTSLDMIADVTRRVLGEGDTDPETIKRHHRQSKPLGLSPGIARLFLRNGLYHNVDINKPEGYEQYISPAVEWANWVNSTPRQRKDFYKDTIHDEEKCRSVISELQKIKCFNCILFTRSCPLDRDLRELQDTLSPYIDRMHIHRSINIVDNVVTTRCPIQGKGSHITQVQVHDDTMYPQIQGNPSTGRRSLPDGHAAPGLANERKEFGSSLSFASVEEVLKQTSAAVADLDKFMKLTTADRNCKP